MNEPVARTIILVVDDSPDTLSMLTAALEQSGSTVLVATGGEQALQIAERVTPDVILLDALMPGMDGFETCRQMKQRPELGSVPVIFMTGLSETEHIVAGLEVGGVDYVTKPIVPEQLIARIRVHLANARASQGARVALDAAGRYLLAADRDGRILWSTPQAVRLLSHIFPEFRGTGYVLPLAIQGWLNERREGGPTGPSPMLLDEGGRRLSLTFVGQIGENELMLRLAEQRGPDEQMTLKERLALTMREAEVLLWLARGKSNRDIGQILGLSPRTVNKHLEQVYAKLGVENRASAAAMAIGALNR